MTAVYSGGLVYEYSQEASGYGLTTISGNDVTELADFTALMTAYAATPNPSGDGGYAASGVASTCPPLQQPEWAVGTTLLPETPSGATKYFTSGAGTAPGLSSTSGSQNSGATFDFSALTGGKAGTSNGAYNGTSNGTTSGSTGSKPSSANGLNVPVQGAAVFLAATFLAMFVL
jgi:hypothetical protein